MSYGEFGVAGGLRAVPVEAGADGYYGIEGCCLDMVVLSCSVAVDCF
jgi:hypothetical protein